MIARRVPIPSQGQLVEVRRRQYVIADVKQSVLPETIHKAGSLNHPDQGQHLVVLSSVDDTLGEDLQVIWEIEPKEWAHQERMGIASAQIPAIFLLL